MSRKNQQSRLILITTVLSIAMTGCFADFKEVKDLPPSVRPPGNNGEARAQTFASMKPIFEANCKGCHQPPNPKSGVDLTNYDAILHNSRHPKLVVPGNADDSDLYNAVKSGDMPPSGLIRQEDIDAIRDWINAGAGNENETLPLD